MGHAIPRSLIPVPSPLGPVWISCLLLLLSFLASRTVAAPPAPPSTKSLPLESAGLRWTYLVHTPPAYEASKKYPVVILVHGGGGDDAEYAAKAYRLVEKADKESFLAVFPNTTSERIGPRPDPEPDSSVTLISGLLDALSKNYAVNLDRIYLCGHSNGAMLTYHVATEFADRIAAFGIVAGTVGSHQTDERGRTVAVPSIPNPKRPVPFIIFHGKKDNVIPYDSDSSMTVAESVAFWVKANGCDPKPATTQLAAGQVIKDAYTPQDPKSHADIVLYTLVRGNHMWPGGRRMPGKDQQPVQDISATDLMWDFFQSHPRTAASTQPATTTGTTH